MPTGMVDQDLAKLQQALNAAHHHVLPGYGQDKLELPSHASPYPPQDMNYHKHHALGCNVGEDDTNISYPSMAELKLMAPLLI